MMDTLVVTNPVNAHLIKAMCESPGGPPGPLGLFDGIHIKLDKHVPPRKPTGRVIFPVWPFIDWEEKDAEWAVPAGIATLETEPVFFAMTTGQAWLSGHSPAMSYVRTMEAHDDLDRVRRDRRGDLSATPVGRLPLRLIASIA